VAVSSVVEMNAIDRDAMTLTTQHLLAGAESLKEKGLLQIDTDHNAVSQQLKITLAGSLPAVRNLLNYKFATDKRLFDERAEVASIAQIDLIQRPFADSIASHLTVDARNHPQSDLPLRIETEYDIPHLRLKIVLNGSIWAVSICLGTVLVRLTQRLERKSRSA
jgi:hypothetical protein